MKRQNYDGGKEKKQNININLGPVEYPKTFQSPHSARLRTLLPTKVKIFHLNPAFI